MYVWTALGAKLYYKLSPASRGVVDDCTAVMSRPERTSLSQPSPVSQNQRINYRLQQYCCLHTSKHKTGVDCSKNS
eukprot:5795287-Amphidinium_carterae.1